MLSSLHVKEVFHQTAKRERAENRPGWMCCARTPSHNPVFARHQEPCRHRWTPFFQSPAALASHHDGSVWSSGHEGVETPAAAAQDEHCDCIHTGQTNVTTGICPTIAFVKTMGPSLYGNFFVRRKTPSDEQDWIIKPFCKFCKNRYLLNKKKCTCIRS